MVVCALTVGAMGAGAAVAQPAGQTAGTHSGATMVAAGSEGPQVLAVQKALGIPAGGQTGAYDARTEANVRDFQRRNKLEADGVVGPNTAAALGLGAPVPGLRAVGSGGSSGSNTSSGSSSSKSSTRSSDRSPSSSSGQRSSSNSGTSAGTANPALSSIAQCESGGNASAVSSDGTYRGKYQFSRETWRSMGGSGDPASASEAEQDRIASKLYASAGSSAWPTCGG